MATLPILWTFRRCPYAMRARLAIQSSRQSVAVQEILLKDKKAAMANNSRNGILNEEAEDLKDAIEIIHWYQFQIHVKIKRGLHGKLADYKEDDDFPKDSDGSMKVALIGIDRSIAAWGKMYAILPEKEDEILELLIQLERLRRFTEKEFPDAREFNRAGFDD